MMATILSKFQINYFSAAEDFLFVRKKLIVSPIESKNQVCSFFDPGRPFQRPTFNFCFNRSIHFLLLLLWLLLPLWLLPLLLLLPLWLLPLLLLLPFLLLLLFRPTDVGISDFELSVVVLAVDVAIIVVSSAVVEAVHCGCCCCCC